MFQNESRLLVADNSGAKELLIIRCLGGSNRKFSYVGDCVVATVKKADPHSDIKQGQIVMALIVTSKKRFQRLNGSFVSFSKNYAVLIKKEDKKLIGTRILVPILREFEEWGYKKLLSLTKEVI